MFFLRLMLQCATFHVMEQARATDPFAPVIIRLDELAAHVGVDRRTLRKRLDALGIPVTRVSPRRIGVTRERAQEFLRRCEAAA